MDNINNYQLFRKFHDTSIYIDELSKKISKSTK